jgi:hypothetical protein
LIAALAALVAGSSGAQAYCNPSHHWDPCLDSTAAKPPQDEGRSRLANAPCGDLALQVPAALGTQACRAANISDADARGREETVRVNEAGRFFFAEYVQAGIHTYIIRRQPTEIVAHTDLKPEPGDWEAQTEIQGFDARRFSASGGTAHCVSFTKHWGHMPQTTGYRHRIIGLYCSAHAEDIADDSLNDLLGDIQPSG